MICFISGFAFSQDLFSSEEQTDNASLKDKRRPFAVIELLLDHHFHSHQRNLKLCILQKFKYGVLK